MSARFCVRCSAPTHQARCACGQIEPPGGWPLDPLLNTWVEDAYRILRRIGSGGSSLVYQARRRHGEGYIALKLVQPQLKHHKWQLRIEREGKVLEQLESPFTVRLERLGWLPDRRLYLAMEYLEGHSMADVLDQCGAFPTDRALLVVLQAAHALAEAHNREIVHLDMKPANLMYLDGQPAGRIKVMDFGIAAVKGSIIKPINAHSVLGTPRYMAPEQVSSPERPDPRSDIFALGLVLYELLSNRFPYPWEETSRMLTRRTTEPPTPIERFLPAPSLPESLYSLVERMIEPKPEQRIQRMEDVLDELLQVLEELKSQPRDHWRESGDAFKSL